MTIKPEDAKKLEELKGKVNVEKLKEKQNVDYGKVKTIVKESQEKQLKQLEEIIKKELDHQQHRIYKGLRKVFQADLAGFKKLLKQDIDDTLEGFLEGLNEQEGNE